MDRLKIFPVFLGLVVAMLCFAVHSVQAGTFPDKPVYIVVPARPGGATDIAARVLVAGAPDNLNGQPVVVVNKPGGNEMIGAKFVAEARSDGYTLLMGWGSPLHTFGRHVDDIPIDVYADFKPVLGVLGYSSCLAVPIDSPFNNLADLVAFAKANPGKLRWTHSSVNGTHWILGMDFFEQAGIQLTEVPNGEGGAQARNMVAGGQVDVGVFASFLCRDFVGTKLKVLGVCYSERDAFFPDVPTFKEQGYNVLDAYDVKLLAAPANTPDEHIAALYKGLSAALITPQAQETLAKSGFLTLNWDPEECLKNVRAMDAMYEKFAESMGMKK